MPSLSGLLLVFGLAALVQGQQTITVQVGQNSSGSPGFAFNPANITANEGDIVSFNFSGMGSNHSVTQSSFAAPCEPLAGGFDSSWVPVSASGPAEVWNLTVSSTSPIWFYCKQLNAPSGGPHCIQGMVGAINAPTTGDRSFDNYVSAARATTDTPGGQNITTPQLAGVNASATTAPGPLSTDSGTGGGSGSGDNSTGGDTGGGDSGNGALSVGASTVLSAAAMMIGIALV
ncbi:hypothetical protein K435DRAFT_973988 [Dendrothele bispora CBS 962.96]|uniref:Cupredoxin n=1 Tax=Dendrothele bispora (strain CBS 962.96) TaxID=1314807 RepID=A0A4S8KPE8_DENBC|nr:hypothetical protein K435DRAFT_973988 [Dendrothele bispora CBS 962.96]